MSDYEDSTITYTVAPPSPDYVPGPEYLPSPEFVPEPVYLEFMPAEDDILPAKEQPLPSAASLAIEFDPDEDPEDDPEDDPEEDPEDDPEEDLADYPADEGDEGDDEDDFHLMMTRMMILILRGTRRRMTDRRFQTTVGTQHEEIKELRAAHRKLQAQFIHALTTLKSCQTQLTAALGSIQILEAARVLAQPEVKGKQEKDKIRSKPDKIGSKPDKNEKRGGAGKSQI
nr:hypothetical protein [Tanacetum cinerariifolium]